MSALDYISIKGFKSISSIEKLELRPINLLIGPNGSGKSNFIGVFTFLHAIREGRLRDYVRKAGGANRILHFGAGTTSKIEIHISFNQGVNQYSIDLEPASGDDLYPSSECVYFWNKAYPRAYNEVIRPAGAEAAISEAVQDNSKVARNVREHLAKWRLYHFHDTSATSPMKRTCDVNDNRLLHADARNIASFLYLLRTKNPASYNLIRSVVALVAPFFEDFSLEPQAANESKIQLEWKHKGSDAYFDASSLSDGTLRFIALATLFLQPESTLPSVVLVDEPELGLHPYAISMLASLIKQASVKAQIIVSTQSPLLLDFFAPDDVLVADRIDGGTQFHRLEGESLNSWLDDFSLGQLWEKNELGGRPSSE